MTSPTRSVIVRLALEPSSYIAGASRAAASTTALNREVAKVGATSATSMERAAASTARAEAAFGKASKTASVFGLKLGELAAAGGLVAAALSVKSAADFQQSLTKLATTAGESAKNLGMVGDGLLDMAGKVGISANELAKGMYTVESGGFHGAAGLKVMSAAAQGAVQEQADLSKVTDAVTTILHDYHLSADDAAKVTSQLVTAVSHGKTTFDELTGSLHSVTPLAAKMGISLADITGTLSAMTASGESADQATQNMANTLQHLAAPTSTMINELAQLGISTNDLANSLSKRGLAGTLQMVEEAIVDHLDPATQRVLLPALNKSKTAAEDLQIMLGQMPPSLRKLSESFLAGKTALSDYRKSARDLGGQQAAMGTQFMSLVTSTQGFNNEIKAGRPAAQVFTAAMQKAFGTTAALNVALQTTGENAAATNDAIKDIAKSSGDGKGNIQGWAEVQKNFNQQLAEAVHGMGSLATETGQHLLPAFTSAFGYINRDVLPAIEHMGSAVGDAAHWWSELPGPIKETTLALAGMAIANKIGLLSALTTRVALLTSGVGRMSAAFREEVAMQKWAATVGGLTGTAATAEANFSRMAVAGGLATRAMGSMRTGASKLAGVFGGPWGIALVGAVVGVTALQNAIEKHDEEVKKATQDVTAWNKAIALGSGGQTALQAQQHLDDLRKKLADVTAEMEKNTKAAQGAPSRFGAAASAASDLGQKQADLRAELAKGEAEWKRQLAAMTPVQEAQARVDIATKDLNDALKHNPANSQAVTNASIRLHDAQAALAGETERTNRAEKTQIQNLQDQANAALASLDAQRAAQMSQLQLADAIDQYNADAKDGQHSTRQLQEEQLGLVDSAEQAAKAAGDAAAATAKQNGATDTATAYQGAYIKTLQDAAAQLTGPAKKAVLDQIAVLSKQATQAQITAGQINTLGITVTDLPKGHLIKIDAPTADQEKALHQLGYDTVHLPDGKVVVTADTHPAVAEIVDLLNYARQQSIVLRASAPDLNGAVSGNGRMGTYATGGVVPGYAPGVDSVHALLSPGEGVLVPEAVRGIGGPAGVRAINSAFSARVPRFADGGVVIPTSIDHGSISSIEGALSSMSRQFSALTSFGSGGNGGLRPLGRMIANNMGVGSQFGAIDYIFTRESGWNPLAQNPTSSAFGIPQFLAATWAAYGGRTTDPALQIRDGIEYMEDRYGSPNAAAAFWAAHHWYDQGGVLPPGVTMAVNGTGRNETIRTAEQEATVQRSLRSREVSGSGYSGGGASPVVVNFQGARITGRLEMGTDGLVTLVDGRIDKAFGDVADARHYAGGY